MNDSNPTVRRFPRTLREAFPQDDAFIDPFDEEDSDSEGGDADLLILAMALVFIIGTAAARWM